MSEYVEEIAELLGIDSWSLITDWFVSKDKCLDRETCRIELAAEVDEFINRIKQRYASIGIEREPVVFIKNDSGTYGLGILSVKSGEELLSLSNRKMKKLMYSKGGVEVENFLIQEGIPTRLETENGGGNINAYTSKEITAYTVSLLGDDLPLGIDILTDILQNSIFDELYCGYEADESIPRTTIGAQELILDLLKERAETGRIYIMNIDHCNSHSSFKDKIEMSNLCQEITLPTYPISHIDDHLGEIALCILSAINVGKVRSDEELEELCDLSVRGLEELIDYQRYPVKAAELATKDTQKS